MKKILPVLMFLLIFSPKIGGSLDSLSIVCMLTFFVSFLTDRNINFRKNILSSTLLYLGFGLVMLAYSILLKSLYGLNDNYQILRFGRVIVNVLGIFGLVRLYLFYYQDEYGKKLVFHLWSCVICHAILMVLMFLVPAVNEFVITKLVQMDEENRTFERRLLGQRIGGLTNTWDAASGVQSLGILLFPFAIKYSSISKNRKWLLYCTIPLTLISILISGVTGMVNIIVVGFVITIVNFKHLKKYVFKTLGIAFILLILVTFVFSIVKLSSLKEAKWVTTTSIGRTLYMVTQDEEFYEKSNRNSTADETVSRISSNMYFLPESDLAFFWGRGGSGRSEDYRVKADPGPTLNLHNLGVFFVIILYSFCFWNLFKAIRSSKSDLYFGIALIAILATILLIDAKVMYLLARQSLSIMLIGYYALKSYTYEGLHEYHIKSKNYQ